MIWVLRSTFWWKSQNLFISWFFKLKFWILSSKIVQILNFNSSILEILMFSAQNCSVLWGKMCRNFDFSGQVIIGGWSANQWNINQKWTLNSFGNKLDLSINEVPLWKMYLSPCMDVFSQNSCMSEATTADLLLGGILSSGWWPICVDINRRSVSLTSRLATNTVQLPYNSSVSTDWLCFAGYLGVNDRQQRSIACLARRECRTTRKKSEL